MKKVTLLSTSYNKKRSENPLNKLDNVNEMDKFLKDTNYQNLVKTVWQNKSNL